MSISSQFLKDVDTYLSLYREIDETITAQKQIYIKCASAWIVHIGWQILVRIP